VLIQRTDGQADRQQFSNVCFPSRIYIDAARGSLVSF